MKTFPEGYVAEVLESLDIDYQEKGRELWALCPGHERMLGRKDNHPSWSINRETGAHLCFSCGYKGNLPTLVRDLGGDIRLIDEGTMPVPEGWSVDRSMVPASPDEVGYRMNPAEMALYRVAVPEEHLEKRRLDMASVVHYDIGWNAEIESWILPFYDPDDGSLLGYQEKSASGRRFNNYPKGISKANTLFGYREMSEERRIVVVESPLDAVLAYRLGHPAVAVCGSRLSDEQLDLLSTFEFVMIALDNDDAGRKENKRLSRMLLPFRYAVAEYPDHSEGKDIGEMSDEQIGELLR